MKRSLGSICALGICVLAASCTRFPGSSRPEFATTREQLAGKYSATPSPKLPSRGENLADVLRGREETEEGEKPEVVELRWASRRALAIRPVGGTREGEFTLAGRMRDGMFVFRNDVDVSGIPWIVGGMNSDQAALGKTEVGNLVVLERSEGWAGVLFFRFGGMSIWSSEYPVHPMPVSEGP